MLRGVYAITPDEPDTDRLVQLVAGAIAGGVCAVQYRCKGADRRLRIEQGSALVALCRRHRVPLIVNDSAEIASLVNADGVHLGRDDGSIAVARGILGRGKVIGASSYDRLELALDAQAAGADYVAFGSFFASGIKPHAPRPPLDLLTRARRVLEIPVVAIGGITTATAPQAIRAGAHAIAVISAIFSAPEPRLAAWKLQDVFEKEALARDES